MTADVSATADIPLPPDTVSKEDPVRRQAAALDILKHVCKAPNMTGCLLELLSQK